MFILNSDITIGKFRFSGVHSVHVKRSLHSIADTAVIQLPSKARIVQKGQAGPSNIITGKQFSDGDPVTIRLGYNGDLQTEFKGFVKHRNLDMPLQVDCEGYSWLLRRAQVKAFKGSVTVKDLLAEAVAKVDAAYPIKVMCDIDLTLVSVNTYSSAFDLISDIGRMTDGCLTCFFIQPDVLWCGLLYTPYATGGDALNQGKVSYRTGYNTPPGNSLKERIPENDPVQVKYNKKLPDGTHLSQSSDTLKSYLRTHTKILNQLKDAPALKLLANEKAYQLNYSGYEGSIRAFLQPYAAPGYQAQMVDDKYPERNGAYLAESIEVNYGAGGAQRIVEIGPRVGFANNNSNG